MYQLCSNLNKDSRDMLWYRIIGMTDLIIHCKSGTYDYDDDIAHCNDEVTRLNPNIYNKIDDAPHYEDSEYINESNGN